METLLYWSARGILAVLQALPLEIVARIGRCLGGAAFFLDARHRKVALANLQRCFGKDRSPEEIRALARENFRRIGENYLSAVRTAAMTAEELGRYVTFVPPAWASWENLPSDRGLVVAIGHFGNFELYARFGQLVPGFKTATTYRGLKQAGLNKLLRSLRERSGCLFFERRTQAGELRAAMSKQRVILGLLADQNAGDRGLRLPFLGEDCSTNAAPAVFALRYGCPLVVGICFRTALARWRITVSDVVPTHHEGEARPVADIMRDVNRGLERAVQADPANWFWVHNRWKRLGREPRDFQPEMER